MYKSFLLSTFLALVPGLGAAAAVPTPPANPLAIYTIGADNISASFIPYGARLTSLRVPDRDGIQQDVAVGFDDPRQYVSDTLNAHSYFGSVVGRYANRINNGTFELDGETYSIPKNEKGLQTLHGGKVGYDQRNWTVTSYAPDSITFTLYDEAYEGFPGNVITHATYSVNSSWSPDDSKPRTQLTTKTVSIALTEKTPIMLSNHIYWNLNAFQASDVLDNTYLSLPLSARYVEGDAQLIPTGQIGDVSEDYSGALDFQQPKLLGDGIENAVGACGTNCTGVDHCFIVDRPTNTSDWTSSPETLTHILSANSTITGINMQVSTNQKATQIYTCNTMDGSIPVRESQQGQGVDSIQQYGCFVVEPEGWIDGINNPEWGQLPYQVFSPETGPAVNWATYVFGAE